MQPPRRLSLTILFMAPLITDLNAQSKQIDKQHSLDKPDVLQYRLISPEVEEQMETAEQVMFRPIFRHRQIVQEREQRLRAKERFASSPFTLQVPSVTQANILSAQGPSVSRLGDTPGFPLQNSQPENIRNRLIPSYNNGASFYYQQPLINSLQPQPSGTPAFLPQQFDVSHYNSHTSKIDSRPPYQFSYFGQFRNPNS